MATLRETLKSTLLASAPLVALLTGGIRDAQELPPDGGSMKNAPKQSDGVRLAPHAVIRWRSDRPFSAIPIGAEQTSIEIYLYDAIGYARIEQAISLIKALLHQQRIQVSDRQFVFTSWVFNSGELTADEYSFAPCRFMRFEITNVR